MTCTMLGIYNDGQALYQNIILDEKRPGRRERVMCVCVCVCVCVLSFVKDKSVVCLCGKLTKSSLFPCLCCGTGRWRQFFFSFMSY